MKAALEVEELSVSYHQTAVLWDISFSLPAGSFIGIIGPNGAGKSTLLKVLSRITEPTTGKIQIKGRVASLLEVGTGFHPELSGRENIFLNGAILGMSRSEIRKKFDEIVDFSGVEKFLDTPVKRYSSGMYVRLAFAVAAHLEPEILIVDEVLSVGDAEFQKKCLGKMEDISAKEGRTVLFVSHNMDAVLGLCKSCILLDKGSLVLKGNVNSVINAYILNKSFDKLAVNISENAADFENEFAKVLNFEIKPECDSESIKTNTPLKIIFEFLNKISGNIHLSLHFRAATGEMIFNHATLPKFLEIGNYKGELVIPANFLNNGHYVLSMLILKDETNILFRTDNIINFKVDDYRQFQAWFDRWEGAVRPLLFPFDIKKISGN
jgi:lipopolysaccharide transport system ATP-binding protein